MFPSQTTRLIGAPVRDQRRYIASISQRARNIKMSPGYDSEVTQGRIANQIVIPDGDFTLHPKYPHEYYA